MIIIKKASVLALNSRTITANWAQRAEKNEARELCSYIECEEGEGELTVRASFMAIGAFAAAMVAQIEGAEKSKTRICDRRLSSVRRSVEERRGRVYIESERGCGGTKSVWDLGRIEEQTWTLFRRGGGERDRERERENLVEDKNTGSDTNKLGLKEKKRVELEMTRRDETRREEISSKALTRRK